MRYEFSKPQKREMAARSGGICEAGKWETEKFYGMSKGQICKNPAAHFDHVTATELSQRPVTIDDGLHVCLVHHRVKTHGHDRPKIKKARDIREKNQGITGPKKKIPSRGFGQWKDNSKHLEDL